MNISTRFHYFFSPPPLWIIQIGKDELIFSRVTKQGITEQEQLYLTPHTLMPNKIANPSSLIHGLNLFCTQKKLSSMRAWFLLPREFFPHPLLPHELFQFLISIKNTPIIPEGVITNPLLKQTQLMQEALPSIIKADNYMMMFTLYNKLHPGWWIIGTAVITLSLGFISSWLMHNPKSNLITPSNKNHHDKAKPDKNPPINESSGSIKNSALLTIIASIIPPTIILERLATVTGTMTSKQSTQSTTKLTGITSSLHDLTQFVTILEEKLSRRCNLSHIKEHHLQSQAAHFSNTTSPTIYDFSLTIEA
jgi:hypothetical protein